VQTAPAPLRVSAAAQTDAPKGKARDDLPPAYDEDERVQRAAAALLAKTHPGADAAPAPVPAATPAAWAQLQRELGASCAVLDGLVAAAPVQPPPPLPVAKRMWTRTPFSAALAGTAAHVLLCMGASAAVVLVLGPAVGSRVPGGPGAYDRLAWESFNALGGAHGEGFDGTNAVWGVVGRLGGGAARRVAGWPT
jgi:hypothetical protein